MDTVANAIAGLPSATASTIKKQGWKGVMRSLSSAGRLVVTNHNEPEAVILSTTEYAQLVAAAESASKANPDPLQVLREQFDMRLAALGAPDAGDRLRDLMRRPGKLDGAVRAGESY